MIIMHLFCSHYFPYAVQKNKPPFTLVTHASNEEPRVDNAPTLNTKHTITVHVYNYTQLLCFYSLEESGRRLRVHCNK